MSLPEITSYITELPQKGFLLGLKIFFITLSLFLAAGIVYLFLITDWYEKRFGADFAALSGPRREGKISKRLRKIKRRLGKGNEAEYKLALLETAALLEKVLKRQGFRGKTLLEQLETAGPDILSSKSLEELLSAYEVLSNISYDPNYRLTLEKAREAVGVFEKTLKELIGP